MESNTAVIVTLLAYNAVLIGVGWWARGRNHNVEDFFLGGRGLGPWVAAISASASSSSAWTLLGVSGAAYAWGLPALWLFPATVGGFLLNWVWVAPRLRIWLEDGGFEREAMYVYRSVRRFDPENMSAVVNEIASTTGPTGAEADKEAWARMLNDLSQSMRDAQFRDRYNRDGPTRFPEHWFLLHATFPADRS